MARALRLDFSPRLGGAGALLGCAILAGCSPSKTDSSAKATSTASATTTQAATGTGTGSASTADPAAVGAGTLAITTLDDYPYTTESVHPTSELAGDLATETAEFDGATGTIKLPSLELRADGTGLVLGSGTGSSTFSSNPKASYGACEMVNRARRFLFEAAGGDAWKCRLGVLGKNPAFGNLLSGEPVKVKFNFDEAGSYLLRFRARKVDSTVTGFELWECEGGEQTGHRISSIDPQTKAYSYQSKTITRPENEDVERTFQTMHASGVVDDDGTFVGLKQLDNTTSNIFASGAVSFNRYQIQQSAAHVLFQGVQQQSDHPEPSRFVAFHDLHDGNSVSAPFALAKLAVGDGAIAISVDGKEAFLQGWSGADGGIKAGVPHLERVRAYRDDLPSVPTPSEISFEGDEVTDCDEQGAVDTAQASISMSDFEVCAGFELDQNDYLQCEEIASQEATE